MGREKKGLILKTLERCRSLGRTTPTRGGSSPRSKDRATTEGYFTVCVGPNRDRFVIKTKYVNHPLFKMLLDEAETKYGFSKEGPLELPCDVDAFLGVLWEMEQETVDDRTRCRIAASPSIHQFYNRAYAGYQMISPHNKF